MSEIRGQRSEDRCQITIFSNIRHPAAELVGRGGFEPPTSRLSSARSNQLSYQPGCQRTEDRGQITVLIRPLTSVLCPLKRKGWVGGRPGPGF